MKLVLWRRLTEEQMKGGNGRRSGGLPRFYGS